MIGKASIVLEFKRVLSSGAIVQAKIWRLPSPTEERPHGYKYSLFMVVRESASSATTTKLAKAIIGIIVTPKRSTASFRLSACWTILETTSQRRSTVSEIRIRVEDTDAFFERTLASARKIDAGDHSLRPAELSFENAGMMFDILSTNRWALLNRLRSVGPTSIRALAKALGRDYRGVHSDVSKLLEAGLIGRDDNGKISVPWSKITAEVFLGAAA